MRFPSARVWALSTVASKEKGAPFTTFVETPISPLTNWNPVAPPPTWAAGDPGGGITLTPVEGVCALARATLPTTKPAKTKVRMNVLFMKRLPNKGAPSVRISALRSDQTDRDYVAKRIYCNICRDLPVGQIGIHRDAHR